MNSRVQDLAEEAATPLNRTKSQSETTGTLSRTAAAVSRDGVDSGRTVRWRVYSVHRHSAEIVVSPKHWGGRGSLHTPITPEVDKQVGIRDSPP